MLSVLREVIGKISYIMESSSSSNDEVDALFESDYSDAVRETQTGSKQKRVKKEQDLVETWLQREEFKNWLEAKTDSD